MKRIALIAHDRMKSQLAEFVARHRDFFAQAQLIATGNTGRLLQERTGLEVERYQSGPLGGDQQIGAEIASRRVHAVFFFRDPLTPQPHEPDITALLRLCDVHYVPAATNPATGEVLLQGLEQGWPELPSKQYEPDRFMAEKNR
ncbi:MAG TPA: methylglyoxal synthase [Firmicutes bacterium]|jgi:methylglyoxal synthase|uniref:methylglyoxal synthase n=1 Tax=Gelria sp. Kuro-4 TaxID=2796927 RepID=UPI0019A7AC8D|nr:methylglyoxal synthase [Gelria sp. Kuro-4]MDI3522473.1 methylglyoxal synthase [Bacillota bacterium]MDK2926481.1 methylglyoxal synthase [Bacillota bacterium]BCV25068.1 methylglyoxal synthase [Gelria sp. Kuro-4]HHV56645.1 methylglyoxal synthase [Bacillota bacterium]